jgi:FkbM family methyltransferase
LIPTAISLGRVRSSLSHWRRRFTGTGSLLWKGVGGLLTDLRLLTWQWNGNVVFRQARVNGFQLLVRAEEDMGRFLYCFERYEEQETKYLSQTIRENDVCIDIGANAGYYSILLAGLAKRGKVHSFEPVPLTYHLLCTNLLLNRISNVVANCCAVADTNGEADFVRAKDSGFSSLVDTGRKPTEAQIRVPVKTLDDYCEQHGVTKVDFVKADVEGAEKKVINGATRLLADKLRKPRLIMLEVDERMLQRQFSSIDQLVRRVQGFGYHPFIVDQGKTVAYERGHYPRFNNVFFASTDFPAMTISR